MAKFAAGDTVIGNSQNCHGVTGTDCVLTVTKVGFNTFSGIIDEHPDDDDCVGESHDGLRYEWFDLQESASSIVAAACSGPKEPPRRFAPLDWVNYQGEKARILGYNEYDSWGGHQIEIMYEEDNETEVVDEDDVEAWITKAPVVTTHRVEDMPKDYKTMNRVQEVIVVMPAHRYEGQKAPEPAKPIVKYGDEKLEVKKYNHEFDDWRTRRRGHVPLDTGA